MIRTQNDVSGLHRGITVNNNNHKSSQTLFESETSSLVKTPVASERLSFILFTPTQYVSLHV